MRFGDREPEAGRALAARLLGRKPLETGRRNCGWESSGEARTWSANRNYGHTSPCALRRDVDPAADRAVFHRVADEVVEGLSQPFRIATHAKVGISTVTCRS